MNELEKKKIIQTSFDILALISIFLSLVCLNIKVRSLNVNFEGLKLFATKTIFFKGNTQGFFENIFVGNSNNFKNLETTSVFTGKNKYSIFAPMKTDNFKLPKISDTDKEDGPKDPNEKTYKIIESQFSSSGTKHENFFVHNRTNINIDIGGELAKKPEIKITKTNKPQVLIMHTHATESYMFKDQGFFYESFISRSDNDKKNVTKVGEEISKVIEKHGIKTVHDKTHNDCPTFINSYERAAKTIRSNLEKNPSIQVVLDIHRDSMGSKETGKIKPTFKFGNEKAAQIMVIAGCDPNNEIGHPNWEKNLRFALRVQKSCESLFPGITRPMKFDKVKYNMHITPGSLLIEIGSDVNTLEEAVRTGAMVGESVAKVLENLM